MLAIRLPKNLENRLENMAKRTGRTKTYYARQAIVEHMDDLEDRYLAESRLEKAEAGRSLAVPLDEFLAERGFIE
jgi:RHH-type transcriptional regulator, rel operon repressor / antitoxin RelB